MDRRDDGEGHRYFEDLAVTHVLGGLEEPESHILRAHLLECADCRARVGELRSIAHELADAEREERRLRSAKAVDTKRRSDDDDAGGDPPAGSGRASRIALVVGLAVLVTLAGWNYTLRGTIGRLEQAVDHHERAASVLELGDPIDVVRRGPGVEGTGKRRGPDLALIIEGLAHDRLYGLYLLRASGEPVFRAAVRPTSGRLQPLMRLEPGAEIVLLTAPDDGPPGPLPEGVTLFEARLSPPP
jgi:anti-sigma factor RsiW